MGGSSLSRSDLTIVSISDRDSGYRVCITNMDWVVELKPACYCEHNSSWE